MSRVTELFTGRIVLDIHGLVYCFAADYKKGLINMCDADACTVSLH